jgi:BASS family bile acid:Na+ symporter
MTLTGIVTLFLAVIIFVVMFGVGLSLTVDSFRQAVRSRRAILTALLCQLVILPLACFLLVLGFHLPPVLAVGMMLLAASPGGTTAVLFSHLAHGDSALSVVLTGLTSIFSAVTLPIVVNLSIHYFPGSRIGRVAFGVSAYVELLVIMLVPIIVGLVIRSRWPVTALRLTRPTRTLTAGLLVLTAVSVLIIDRAHLLTYARNSGLVAAVFCVISLAVGYFAARAQRLPGSQATSVAMATGVHNSSLAIAIALSRGLLSHQELAVPPTVYAVVTVPIAWLAGRLMRGALTASDTAPEAVRESPGRERRG